MSLLNVNTIEPSTGTAITLGASGDTITVPSGATITNSGTATNFAPIGISSSMTSGSGLAIDSAGHVTMPLQSCFSAYNNLAQSNVTGDDTMYTVLFDTERFDLNGDFASNTFTAPVTGKYFVHGAISLDAGSSSNTRFQNVIMMLTCSNRKLKFGYNTIYTNEDDHMQINGSGVIDMDANDTFNLQVFASRHGASGATTTVGSSTDLRSGFGGYLLA